MRGLCTLSAMAGIALIAGSAWACDKDAKLAADKQQVAAGQASGCCKSAAGSVVEKVMERMPRMTYKVGDFETCCPDAAKAKAGADGKIQFKVAGEVYGCKAEALTELGILLEGEAKKMTQVVFAVGDETFACPMAAGQTAKQKNSSMTYRVAGLDFADQAKADQAVKLVSEITAAKSQTSQTTLVGASATPGCSKPCGQSVATAGQAAAEPGKPGCGMAVKTAAVEGQTETGKPCSGAKVAAVEGKSDGVKPCCASGAKLAAAGAQPASAAAAVEGQAAAGTPACCQAAEERVASAQAKIRLMVETAATAL